MRSQSWLFFIRSGQNETPQTEFRSFLLLKFQIKIIYIYFANIMSLFGYLLLCQNGPDFTIQDGDIKFGIF